LSEWAANTATSDKECYVNYAAKVSYRLGWYRIALAAVVALAVLRG